MKKCFALFVLLLLCTSYGFSQEKEPVPDGTEGEFFDTVPAKRKYANWNQFDGVLTTLRIGGGFLYDFVGYVQDDASEAQLDSADAELEYFGVRDFRITAGGQFKTKFKRSLTWKVGLMYDGDKSAWFVRESGLMIEMPELSGHIFIGRTKEGFSQNKVMNGYAGWTMERQMALDVIPILADGIKFLGFLPKQRLFWNVGIYHDFLAEKQGFATYDWQFAARVGWLAVYSKPKNIILHMAGSFRYGNVDEEGSIRVKSRPEANPAPFFLDTETFPSDHSIHYGGEVYLSVGSLLIGSEYYLHQFDSPETGDPVFRGGEAVVCYIITGEKRAYSTVGNIYGFIPVDKPVFQKGPGAWEAVLRFSALDLDDGSITGGKMWRITPMMNWYMSKNVRLEFVYGYGVLERFGLEGATHFFQSRIQLQL